MNKINRSEMRRAWLFLPLPGGREVAARIAGACWRSALRETEKQQIIDEAARMGIAAAEVRRAT